MLPDCYFDLPVCVLCNISNSVSNARFNDKVVSNTHTFIIHSYVASLVYAGFWRNQSIKKQNVQCTFK